MAKFWLFLKLLPDLILLVKKLLWAIEAGADYVEAKIDLSKFQKASAKAKDTKDTSDLEKRFRG